VFIKHVTKKVPFVTLKMAQTLDGKIATATGESKWITGKEARIAGHRLRDRNDAILVGINTVLKDDPYLTARIAGGRDPLRVIVDSALRISPRAKVIAQTSAARTIVATLANAPKDRIKKLQAAGAEIVIVKSDKGRVDLRDLMRMLGRMDIMSVLVEGGAEIHASALKSGIVDKVVIYIAPMLMTGSDSLCSIGGVSPIKLGHAIRLKDVTSHFVGQDIMVQGYIKK